MSDDASLTSRLLARGGPGIQRRSMPDGGEVYSGQTASRALKALGARAMTMDGSIFVDNDFDLSNPEDAALYAHERHHQAESGGFGDGHGPRDAEEVAARAIERMVLHRSQKGESFGSIMRDVKMGRVSTGGGGGQGIASAIAGPGSEAPDPMAAYSAMIASGKDHNQVIRELTDFVMSSLARLEEESSFRNAGNDFF